MGRGYHNSSDAVAALLHPEYGYREQQKQRGKPQKDFQHLNILHIKQMQRQHKEAQKAQEEQSMRRQSLSQFTLEQFQSVPARYAESSSHRSQTFMTPIQARRDSQGNGNEKDNESASNSCKTFRKSQIKDDVPTLRELKDWKSNVQKARSRTKSVDYIRRNAKQAVSKPPLFVEKQKLIVREGLHVDKNFGQVPLYLVKRRLQWAKEEEKQRNSQKDPECPAGMIRMSEEERRSTLQILQKVLRSARKEKVEKKWNALPLRLETMRQIQRKNTLDAKLEEIEKAIQVFNEKNVFVAKDMLDNACAPLENDMKNQNSAAKQLDHLSSACDSLKSRLAVVAA